LAREGSYDPTLVEVELTQEEAEARANRRSAFQRHLQQTDAEKELVLAFAKMYRMNEKPDDPLQWLLDYFERDQRGHIKRAEDTAEEYRIELSRVEKERDELINKMDEMRQTVRNLERTVTELRRAAQSQNVVGLIDDSAPARQPSGGEDDAFDVYDTDKKEKKEKKEKNEKKEKKEKKQKKEKERLPQDSDQEFSGDATGGDVSAVARQIRGETDV